MKKKKEVGVTYLLLSKIASNDQKVGEEHGADSPSQPSEETYLAHILISISNIYNCKTSYNLLLFLATQFVVRCYGNLRKLVQNY